MMYVAMSVLPLILLSMSCLAASERNIICLPTQWQGIEMVTIDMGGYSTKAYMNVSFDANLKKVASDLFITSSGKVIHEYALQDFKTGTTYQVVGNKCKKEKITTDFPWCLPSSAKVLLKSYVGVGDTKISTTTYAVPSNTEIGSGFLTVTDLNIPVNFQLSTIMNGAPVDVYGITNGIKNPAVFNLPDICR